MSQKTVYRFAAVGTEDTETAINGQMGSTATSDPKVPEGMTRISHVAIQFCSDQPANGAEVGTVRLQGGGLTGVNKPYDFPAGAQGGQADGPPLTHPVAEFDTDLPCKENGTVEMKGYLNGSADPGQIAIGVELTFDDEGRGNPNEAWITRHTSTHTDDGVDVELAGVAATATAVNRSIIPDGCTQIVCVAIAGATDGAVIGDCMIQARLSGQALKGETPEFVGPAIGGDLVTAGGSNGGMRIRKTNIPIKGGNEIIMTADFDPTDTGAVATAIGICCR